MKKFVFMVIAMLCVTDAIASDVNLEDIVDSLVQQEDLKIELMRQLYTYAWLDQIFPKRHPENITAIKTLVSADKIDDIMTASCHESFVDVDITLLAVLNYKIFGILDARKKVARTFIADALATLTDEQKLKLMHLYENEVVDHVHEKLTKALFISTRKNLKEIYLAHFERAHDKQENEVPELSLQEKNILDTYPAFPSDAEFNIAIEAGAAAIESPHRSLEAASRIAAYVMHQAMSKVRKKIDDVDLTEYLTLTEESVLRDVRAQINKSREAAMAKIAAQKDRIYGDKCVLF